MNGSVLLDSNIIILASKGASMERVLSLFERYYISVISHVEVMGYPFEKKEEESFITTFLNILHIVQTNNEIAHFAINYRKANKIKLADALILATARFLKAGLLTENKKDFIGIDKSVKIISLSNLNK